MRFDVITLLPELIEPYLSAGVTRRAFEGGGLIEVKLWQLRQFSQGNYRRVDERPFGGGPGMVMLAEPLAQCVQAIVQERQAVGADAAPRVILFTPAGRRFDQAAVTHWSAQSGAILVCGRYEGIDQRFIQTHVTDQISLGDFILSGGEIAAVAMLDALARCQPGVLKGHLSCQIESFNEALDGMLDTPQYTRPECWRGIPVPAQLLSGHHAQIASWRRHQSLLLTARERPDLIHAARCAGRLSVEDEALLSNIDV